MKKNIVKKVVAITFAAAMALTISPMAKAATTDQQASRIKIICRGSVGIARSSTRAVAGR